MRTGEAVAVRHRLFFVSAPRGFTLVEIMVVVAILTLLAVMIIPNAQRARHNANETAAIEALRRFSTALENYRAGQIPPTYPAVLDDLSDADPQYATESLTDGTNQGYTFEYDSGSNATYELTANPEEDEVTGTRIFFVNETGVIRLDDASGEPIS